MKGVKFTDDQLLDVLKTGISQTQIAKRFGVSAPSISIRVKRLREKGLLPESKRKERMTREKTAAAVKEIAKEAKPVVHVIRREKGTEDMPQKKKVFNLKEGDQVTEGDRPAVYTVCNIGPHTFNLISPNNNRFSYQIKEYELGLVDLRPVDPGKKTRLVYEYIEPPKDKEPREIELLILQLLLVVLDPRTTTPEYERDLVMRAKKIIRK